MTPFTKEYVDSLNWEFFKDNEDQTIWTYGRFELTYYKDIHQFYLHIDDERGCTVGDTKIDYLEEFQLYLRQFNNTGSTVLNTRKLLDDIKSNPDFIPIPSSYDFALEPFNTPLYKAADSNIVILHGEDSDEIEFMFNDIRTEFLILNEEMFEAFYNFYKNFEF